MSLDVKIKASRCVFMVPETELQEYSESNIRAYQRVSDYTLLHCVGRELFDAMETLYIHHHAIFMGARSTPERRSQSRKMATSSMCMAEVATTSPGSWNWYLQSLQVRDIFLCSSSLLPTCHKTLNCSV